ncbi:MAG: 1-acyl-sn-glycerol-3-phosphate acyltransferase [Desulfobacterales bacterium]|nr:1-acyl-sn-glycerol-3-phosphate acyltransferase [Desulfobacterales bacterium]
MIDRLHDDAQRMYSWILPNRLGLLTGTLVRWILGRIRFDDAQKESLGRIQSGAIVIYVAKHHSRMERLFSHSRLHREGLPGARVGFGCPLLLVFPMVTALRLVLGTTAYIFRHFSFPDPALGDYLKNQVIQGGGFLHLVEPALFSRRFGAVKPDPLEFLVTLQRSTDRPIYLVPQLFFYSSGSRYARRPLLTALFGLEPRSGLFERCWKLLFVPKRVFVELSEPVSLAPLIDALDDGMRSDGDIALAIRREMIDRITCHRQSVTGPVLSSVEEIRQKVLTGDRLQGFMKSHARRRNISLYRVRREAVGHVDDIAALPNPYVIRPGMVFADWMVSHLFAGLHVDESGLHTIKRASQQGPVVLIPCHKSHMDGLVLSYVMHRHHLPCPYIFAGHNLSFWPMGWLLRRLGAFFVRRSFKGAVFYAMVFSEYIHLLLEQGPGTHIAAFIEGTRSRSGKLLPPQAGMLSLMINAVQNGACEDLNLVPIFIGYDKVPDEGSYLNEVRGGEKATENFWQMMRAWRVMGRRYGKIYVHFAAPISLGAALAERSQAIEQMSSRDVNQFSRNLGASLLNAVNVATRVTPQALVCAALLNRPLKSVSIETFCSLTRTYLTHLKGQGAALAASLHTDPDGAMNHILRDLIRSRHIEALSDPAGKGRIPDRFRVKPARRLDLEYYKNNCIAFFAHAAFTAAAILRTDAFQFTASALRSDYVFLAELMSNEFPRLDDEDDGRRIRKTLKTFIDDAIVVPHPTLPETYLLTAGGRRKALGFSAFLSPLLESYTVVLRYLEQTQKNNGPRIGGTERLKRIERLGRRMFRRGDISRKEALSRVNYAHAVAAFSQRGITGRNTHDALVDHCRIIRDFLNRITA